MRTKLLQIFIILWVASFCTLTCTRPKSTVSPMLENLEYLETPREVSPGELARVVLRAPPGADCDIIFYWQVGGEWKQQWLETRTAGAEGMCSWEWSIPLNASPGEGGFRNDVRYGDQSRSLPPRTFEIVESAK